METEENIVEKHRNCLERQRTKQPSSSKRLWPAGGAGWGPACRLMHRTFPHVAFGFQTAG